MSRHHKWKKIPEHPTFKQGQKLIVKSNGKKIVCYYCSKIGYEPWIGAGVSYANVTHYDRGYN